MQRFSDPKSHFNSTVLSQGISHTLKPWKITASFTHILALTGNYFNITVLHPEMHQTSSHTVLPFVKN